MKWIRETSEGIVLTIRAVPRASKTETAGVTGDALRIRLKAPPLDGKANTELIRYLSEVTGAGRRSIVVLSGETGRLKRVFVKGIRTAEALRLLSSG